jgi:hypothetical protein
MSTANIIIYEVPFAVYTESGQEVNSSIHKFVVVYDMWYHIQLLPSQFGADKSNLLMETTDMALTAVGSLSQMLQMHIWG